MKDSGFRNPELGDSFDSFLGTSKEKTARKYKVIGANFIAHK